MIRALVVDDEALARDGIRLRLRDETDFSIVGEAIDGPSAVDAIGRLRPDLVFLDVHIPGFDGFEVLRRLPSHQRPAVIFVTAHDRYAVQAFDEHAVDYLLKPVDAERFQHTLNRVRQSLTSGEAGAPAAYCRRFTVREGDHFVVVKAADVDWFESASNYVQLHVRGREYLLRLTLSALEERLDPAQFVRIHRSTIVNLDRVAEIRPTWQGDFSVGLTDGKTTLRLSRSYRERVLSLNPGD